MNFIFLLVPLFLLLTATSIFFYVAQRKLQTKNTFLQGKLLQIENKTFVEDTKLLKKQPEELRFKNPSRSSESVELRKEIYRLKDEIKKYKDNIKKKEHEIHEQEESCHKKSFSLVEENKAIIRQIKELDLKNKEYSELVKKTVPLPDFKKQQHEIHLLQEELLNQKKKFSAAEKQIKNYGNQLSLLQEKLKISTDKIELWNKIVQVKPGVEANPRIFLKWRDRALEGRRMYQLMRQMRELSDIKLETYQNGLLQLSCWVLKKKNLPLPMVNSGEQLVDKSFAMALDAILSEKFPLLPNVNGAALPAQEILG